MDKQNYKSRISDWQMEEYLFAFGAVCIEGPKWCGKIWTASYRSKRELYIGDAAGNFQNRQLAELSPLIWYWRGETPCLIDEWQEVFPFGALGRGAWVCCCSRQCCSRLNTWMSSLTMMCTELTG